MGRFLMDWQTWRQREFPQDHLNFNPGTLGTPSQQVLNALGNWPEGLEAWPLGQYAAGRAWANSARERSRRLWGLTPALTGGTTSTMQLLFLALLARMGGRLRILSSAHEHEGGSAALLPGVTQGVLSEAGMMDPQQFRREVEEFRPDVVLLSQVTWTEGRRLPVETLGQVLRACSDARLILDAAQVIGISRPVLEADLVVASAHKWLGGPAGTGFLWANERTTAELSPYFGVGHPLDSQPFEPRGGQDFSRLRALDLALSIYEQQGVDASLARSRRLAKQFAEGLATILRRRLFFQGTDWSETPNQSDGVVVVRLEADPYPLYQRLDQRGLHLKCIKGTNKNGVVYNQLRAGIPWYETEARVDRALSLIAELVDGE